MAGAEINPEKCHFACGLSHPSLEWGEQNIQDDHEHLSGNPRDV